MIALSIIGPIAGERHGVDRLAHGVGKIHERTEIGIGARRRRHPPWPRNRIVSEPGDGPEYASRQAGDRLADEVD
jgi:hypothetical protein